MGNLATKLFTESFLAILLLGEVWKPPDNIYTCCEPIRLHIQLCLHAVLWHLHPRGQCK